MSQLVKPKRQANFKGFKRFGAFKGLVEQKNVVFNSFVCKFGLFWQFSNIGRTMHCCQMSKADVGHVDFLIRTIHRTIIKKKDYTYIQKTVASYCLKFRLLNFTLTWLVDKYDIAGQLLRCLLRKFIFFVIAIFQGGECFLCIRS
jgi:hypothetical protein